MAKYYVVSLQSPTKMKAARRCPSPAAPRTRPSSTAPSALPTGSTPPRRPRPSPPRPAAPRRISAQRRASHGGAPPSLSLQGADRPKLCRDRPHWSAAACSSSLTNRGKGFSLSFSSDHTLFNLFLNALFSVECILYFIGF